MLAPLKAVEPEQKSVKVVGPKRIPMEFKEASVADVPKYIEDPNYFFQQKVDGVRAQLALEPGKKPWFRSKSGDQLQNTTAAKIYGPLLAKLGEGLPDGAPAVSVDGEMLDGKWYVFDMTVAGSEGLPWEKRMAMAEDWVKSLNDQGIKSVTALPTARTPEEKRALFEAIKSGGGEGVMMKRRDAKYKFGQRTDEILKAKITASADVVVMDRNVDGKVNAVVGVYKDGKLTRVANIPMQGKPDAKVGDVIEVEYLWAHPGSGLLTQARMKKVRPDKNPLEASDSQFRFVNKDVIDLPAPASPGVGPSSPLGKVNFQQAAELRARVPDSGDDRDTFMQEALDGYERFGDAATVIASTDENGNPVAAASLIRMDDLDEFGLPAYYKLDYAATSGPGHGRALADAIRAQADEAGIPVYFEATQSSHTFWEKMGAVPDPDGLGIELYGWPSDGKSDGTVSPGEITPPADAAPEAAIFDQMPYAFTPVGDIMDINADEIKGILGGIVSTQQYRLKPILSKLSAGDPDVTEAATAYVSGTRKLVEDKKTFIAMPVDRVGALLADGRFKTVFEKVTSTGGGDGISGKNTPGYMTGRRQYEDQVAGVGGGKGVKPAVRPVYGYVGPSAGLSGARESGEPSSGVQTYGDIHVELKPSAAGRTTVTFDDSLNSALIPIPLNDVANASDRQILQASLPGELYWFATSKDGDKAKASVPRSSYVEAQIHGGVSLGDIARFVVPRAERVSALEEVRSEVASLQAKVDGGDASAAYSLKYRIKELASLEAKLASIDAAIEQIKGAGHEVEVV